MKKYMPIYIYGVIIILEGIFLLTSRDSTFNIIRLSLGISLGIGAILAFLAALRRKRLQVQFSYHEMHALAMMAYGLAILILGNTIDKVISFTAFLLIFYAFSEIILCNWLFNLSQKLVFKIVIIRTVLGLLIGIGTMAALNFEHLTLEIFGVLFILVGVNIILYIPVMNQNREIDYLDEFPD
jgi:uncharacterized membrane protein HdeD (DUF308 family)